MIDEYCERVFKLIIKGECTCYISSKPAEYLLNYDGLYHVKECPCIRAQYALLNFGISPRWRINRKK